MSNINRVILTGRIGADAELKFTPNGIAVIDFSIAVNDYAGKDKPEYTNWINCTMFNKEKLVNYLKKGMKITLEGKLRNEQWETNGEKRSKLKVIVDSVELPGKNESTQTTQTGNGYQPTDDDNIPF
jgi:single-strand DNA-binding protein